MYEASKCAPQEALRCLDTAFKNFLSGKASYPKFKSRSKGLGNFHLTGSVSVEHRFIKLPRLGRLRLKPGERGYVPEGKYSSATVSEKAGRWYVSFVGAEIPECTPSGSSIGIDLGVARLATMSDGAFIENSKALQKESKKLKKAQRSVSRKKKGSKNRKKAVERLRKVHARISNIRQDALHKATTMLTKSHGYIVIEDLKVQNMTKKGGSNKRGLNRVVMDASFGEFRRMLEYKGKKYGAEIRVVPPHYTSQTCSSCGYVGKGNRLSQSRFQCQACGHEANADVNAAINILVAGSCPETLNACGEDVRRASHAASLKQESTVSPCVTV